jgi:hypothetical protein
MVTGDLFSALQLLCGRLSAITAGEFVAKAIDYDEYHVPRGATFVSCPAPVYQDRAIVALEFLTKHFAVVSAIAVLAAFILGMDFLYAYLGRFDWSLIWLVEYSDIFKVGLIVVGFLAGGAFSFHSLITLLLARDDTRTTKLMQAAIFFFAVFFAMMFTAIAYFAGGWDLAYMTLFSYGVALWALLRVRELLMTIPDISARRMIEDFLIVAFAIGTIGSAVGLTVREYKTRYKYSYDVTLKEGKLEEVAVVMVTAHHTILYANDQPIVVPNADVLKLQRRLTQPTKIECTVVEAC